MKSIFLFLFFIPLIIAAQTGPAGVQTSTSNFLWMDANTGVAVTGTAVTSWTDRSGNARVASPTATAYRPTLVTSSVNTNSSISFDGFDDELQIPYVSALDLAKWHFFIVVRASLEKNYNYWFGKGNDGAENYEMLSYNDGNVHTPILLASGRTAPSSGSNQVTTTEFNIIEYSFNTGTNRARNVFKNGTNIYNDVDNSTAVTNTFPLYIGNEKATTVNERNINGNVAEIICYNGVLNAAERVIINNYLSAKYNIPIATVYDKYAGSSSANGDYDFQVAGVGQSAADGKYVTGSNTSASSSISGGLDVTESTAFENGEYLIYGHQSGNNLMNYSDIGGMSAGPLVGRWNRIWYLDWTHVGGTTEKVNLTFDISDGGMSAVPATPLSNYKLLYRTGLSGNWTEVANASSISVATERITFNNIPYTEGDGYYTIGTLNNTISPLPIELTVFKANVCDQDVCLDWTTASERNNDHFSVEKTKDGAIYEGVATVAGAGNSTSVLNYSAIDHAPYEGVSYYRLKQVDFNGNYSYSNLETVDFSANFDWSFNMYPNPNGGENINIAIIADKGEEVKVNVYDVTGKKCYSKVLITNDAGENTYTIDPSEKLPSGMYMVVATSKQHIYNKKLIVN